MRFALPVAVAWPFVLVHREASFRVRRGSRSDFSSMDDRPERQTSTLAPAEPGGLLMGGQRMSPYVIAGTGRRGRAYQTQSICIRFVM